MGRIDECVSTDADVGNDSWEDDMGKAKPILLPTIRFDSKKEAIECFRGMLNKYSPGERVSDADASHLAGLFACHSEYERKRGVGVDHFEVMSADYRTQCFRVVRVDGTGEDFSFYDCIDGAVPS
jgi:hypothetical protein